MTLSELKVEHCDQMLGALYLESKLHAKLSYHKAYTRDQILEMVAESQKEMKQDQLTSIERLVHQLEMIENAPVIESDGSAKEDITDLIKK